MDHGIPHELHFLMVPIDKCVYLEKVVERYLDCDWIEPTSRQGKPDKCFVLNIVFCFIV